MCAGTAKAPRQQSRTEYRHKRRERGMWVRRMRPRRPRVSTQYSVRMRHPPLRTVVAGMTSNSFLSQGSNSRVK